MKVEGGCMLISGNWISPNENISTRSSSCNSQHFRYKKERHEVGRQATARTGGAGKFSSCGRSFDLRMISHDHSNCFCKQRKKAKAEQKARRKAAKDEQDALFGEALLAIGKKQTTNQKGGKAEAKGRDADDDANKKTTSRAMKMMYQSKWCHW